MDTAILFMKLIGYGVAFAFARLAWKAVRG